MVLEATVIIVDNSEWMRNGDYIPSRIEAQQDAVNLICSAKTQANPESTVSVMSMGKAKNGSKAEVLVTLTQDIGKILSCIHSLQIYGEPDFSAALQVAQLVLKHRQNKNQQQRIIAFIGSPLKETSEDLANIGKKLKKNNIAVDLVNFGEEAENTEKLENFIQSVNTADGSHLVNIPPGGHILSDVLVSTPIFTGEGSGTTNFVPPVGGAPVAGDYDFGVDPSLDPELAMVLRLSMEEERARREEARRKSEQEQQQQQQQQGAAGETKTTEVPATTEVEMSGDDDEELQKALALSMNTDETLAPSSVELTEDEEMQQALAMSNAPPQQQQQQTSDQDFLNSVLQSLPGVDMNDERIRNMLSSLQTDKQDKDEKKEKE